MLPLEPPDTHHLSAAIGWMELGNSHEAVAELNSISAAQQRHPDVLEARWLIHAQENHWEAALEFARSLVEVAPQRSSGWLHRAYALRRVPNGGLKVAWNALLPAAVRFPKEPTIPYNLACYACQMGQLDDARLWLKKAVRISSNKNVKEMALLDEDLQALWPEIRDL